MDGVARYHQETETNFLDPISAVNKHSVLFLRRLHVKNQIIVFYREIDFYCIILLGGKIKTYLDFSVTVEIQLFKIIGHFYSIPISCLHV